MVEDTIVEDDGGGDGKWVISGERVSGYRVCIKSISESNNHSLLYSSGVGLQWLVIFTVKVCQ